MEISGGAGHTSSHVETYEDEDLARQAEGAPIELKHAER
ncbi:hypothetical protein PAMC26577_32855 [Caballeronia sordidicola]|uniref:Uncharacterized protein n=1 Tax=Caballeronia sordidicola TaxID=196367 RepID=A0A242MBA0_CABSO|nr:hypothetical protein PAMC26577_32855 [Caballeronia sordidicola]